MTRTEAGPRDLQTPLRHCLLLRGTLFFLENFYVQIIYTIFHRSLQWYSDDEANPEPKKKRKKKDKSKIEKTDKSLLYSVPVNQDDISLDYDEYWRKNGEQHLWDLWVQKYSEHFQNNTAGDTNTQFECIEDTDNQKGVNNNTNDFSSVNDILYDNTSNETAHVETEWSDEWLELWNEHVSEISYHYFTIYPKLQKSYGKIISY